MGDSRRSSFVGLTIANLGQQPWAQVVGPYLTLLVASRTNSAIAITFALTAHRGATAIVLPLVGRLSDRSTARAGRRVPFIVGGTMVAAAGVSMMTSTNGYWPLVGAVVVARVGMQVATIGKVGVTPDVFGRSRWAKAVAAISAIGFLPSLLTLALIRSTWDQADPATWRPTFLLAAAGLVVGALAVAALVREAPATSDVAAIAADGSWRDELHRVRAVPNGTNLLIAAALLAAALSASSRLLPVWARDNLGLGGAEFADLSVVLGVVSAVMVPVGLFLASRAAPRTLAISAAIVGAAATGACAFIDTSVAFVVLTAVTIPLTVAALAALVPAIIPLFPKGDRLGQAFGMTVGPFGLLTASVSLGTAVCVDLVDNTNLIWIITAALLLVLAVDLTRLRMPSTDRTDVRDLLRRARAAGLGPGLFDGSVDLEDVLGVGSIAPQPDTSATPISSPPIS